MFGVATIDFRFPRSCSIEFRGSLVPNMASCGGVAMYGVGFPTSCAKASRGWPMQQWHLLAASRRLVSRRSTGFRRRFECYPEARVFRNSRHKRRRFYVVSNGIPWSICSKYGFLRWSSKEWHRDARRLFSFFISIAVPWPICAIVMSFSGVALIGLGTISVGFPTSCPTASLDHL
jgi:hypothetical protein